MTFDEKFDIAHFNILIEMERNNFIITTVDCCMLNNTNG